MIESGTPLLVRDAEGVEHHAVAASGIQKGHQFEIVWVTFPQRRKDRGKSFDPMPWPADAVRELPPEEAGTP